VRRVAKPVKPGTIIRGRASWYGPGFHGRRTASGERFNRHGSTLAHRGLPFGTRLEITNLKNGRSAVGRVTDRGPHVRGRVVDLSEALARRLGIRGVGSVRCVVLPKSGVGKRVASVERKSKVVLAPAASDTPCPVDTGLLFGPVLPAEESAPVSPVAGMVAEMAAAEPGESGQTP
jgi:rare lipoprotein A